MSLATKYRPNTIDEIVGQEHIKRYLTNATKNDKIGSTYLLSGNRGTGKTSSARILALIINCGLEYDVNSDLCQSIINGVNQDIVEVDAASNTSIDNIREIRKLAQTSPVSCKKRVFIIDEVHCLRSAAAAALLHIIEEPPFSTVFILATTEEQKIPDTIRSRCIELSFKNIKAKEITERLSFICKNEKISLEDEKSLHLISTSAKGSLRDAISKLELIINSTDNKEIKKADILSYIVRGGLGFFCDLLECVYNKDYKKSIILVRVLFSNGGEPKDIFEEILEDLHSMMISKIINSHKHLAIEESIQQRWLDLRDSISLESMKGMIEEVILYSGKVQDSIRPDILLDCCIVSMIKKNEIKS